MENKELVKDLLMKLQDKIEELRQIYQRDEEEAQSDSQNQVAGVPVKTLMGIKNSLIEIKGCLEEHKKVIPEIKDSLDVKNK